jgi:hypothetical protein
LDAIAERGGSAQPQELGLNRHSHRPAWLGWEKESSLAGQRSATRIEGLFSHLSTSEKKFRILHLRGQMIETKLLGRWLTA